MTAVHPQVRRKARERAVQFLFSLDFTRYEWADCIEDFWRDNPSRPGVRRYAEQLIEGVAKHQAELDEAIERVLNRWAPERVGRIERNVIRVALYEMRYGEEVPENVAINEAMEVAKRFGSEEGPRFVNAVLDRLKGG